MIEVGDLVRDSNGVLCVVKERFEHGGDQKRHATRLRLMSIIPTMVVKESDVTLYVKGSKE